ncbi:MAG: hypothetical protein IKZ82_04860 [Clostridia bacterium]|nr:hypothetical protein [Clostridia bacterium]
MEGIIIFFVIASIISAVTNAAKKNQQNSGNRSGGFSSSAGGAAQRTGAYTGTSTSEQRARLEQLRKLQQQRQQASSNANRSGSNAEKPIYPHETEDCGGGSIHDGYHEGTVRRPAPASSAEGRLGKQGVSDKEGRGASELYKKDWNERRVKAADIPSVVEPAPEKAETASAPVKSEPSGAERLSKALADKPAIVQGLIWSEVLGRPLSDSR